MYDVLRVVCCWLFDGSCSVSVVCCSLSMVVRCLLVVFVVVRCLSWLVCCLLVGV